MCLDFLSHLLSVRDPQADWIMLHPLEEILLPCIYAVVSGARGWKASGKFGETKLTWLRQFLPSLNGIPSPGCLGRAMAGLPAKAFQDCCIALTLSVAQLTEGEGVAVEGKTLRGSQDRGRGQAAIHLASAWGRGLPARRRCVTRSAVAGCSATGARRGKPARSTTYCAGSLWPGSPSPSWWTGEI